MISRMKSSKSFVAAATMLLCGALSVAAPSRLRTVKRLSRPDEPVQILAVKMNGKPVVFGKSFMAKDDWLGGLTLVIKNVSERSVSWVNLDLGFHKPPDPGVRLVEHVTYGIGRWDEDKIRGGGPPLKPGETVEVPYSIEQYHSIREIMDGMAYPKSIPEVEVSVEQVIFADQPELMWIEGKMNEFHSPTGWRPVKP
jgi:hypothetical protein